MLYTHIYIYIYVYVYVHVYVYLMNQMAAAQKQISYLLKTQFSCTTRTMVTQCVIDVVLAVVVLIVSASVLVFVVLQANNGEIKYY